MKAYLFPEADTPVTKGKHVAVVGGGVITSYSIHYTKLYDEFRNAREGSEQTALITALLLKEIDSKAKVSLEEIQAEAKKIMAADNTLSDNTANVQAGRSVSRAKIRKVQEELIDAAKKEFPATIHQEIVLNIDTETYYEVIRKKTASLIAACTAAGAAAAGAEKEVVEKVHQMRNNFV